MSLLPLVSIGLPVYNGELHLRSSLGAILGQDYPNLEIIISDNASTDNTWDICKEFAAKDSRIILSRNDSNKGAFFNFLNVMGGANGDFFMWAAHDDLHVQTYVSDCLLAFDANPSAIMCCTELGFINEDGSTRKNWHYNNIESIGKTLVERIHEVISRCGWFATYALFRRAAIPILSRLKECYGGDVILLIELAIAGECAKVHKPLYYRREPDKPKDSQKYMQEITGVSRKRLGFKTPSEVFHQSLKRVALRT